MEETHYRMYEEELKRPSRGQSQWAGPVLTTHLAVKPILHLTNRWPLALKSRGVVEFTAAEGLVTRNKSTSPVFR